MKSKKPLTYGEYLQLDKILNAQHLKSEEYGKPAHHELFFITIHQSYELWFKQILAELNRVIQLIQKLDLGMQQMPDILNSLERVNKIQGVLNQQITVLETLTPADFLTFRDLLTPASGNQSWQFRMIEIRLGLHPEQDISTGDFFRQLPEVDQKKLQQIKQLPSLYETVESWLMIYAEEATKYMLGYKQEVETKLTDRQAKLNNQPKNHAIDIQLEQFKSLRTACAEILDQVQYEEKRLRGQYRLKYPGFLSALYLFLNQNHEELSDAYKLLKRLIELDELMALWRFHHALMVQRMIGHKFGTGGTSGYTHLRGTVEKGRVFSEFTNLSGYMLSDIYLDY